MFREIILPIFRSTRLCVTICGIMHRRCCRPEAGNIVGATWLAPLSPLLYITYLAFTHFIPDRPGLWNRHWVPKRRLLNFGRRGNSQKNTDCILNTAKVLKLRNSTCFEQFLCPSPGVFQCTFSCGICHTGILTPCDQDQDGTEFHSDPGRKLSAYLYDIYHSSVYSGKTPDDEQRNSPKLVEFHSENKFEISESLCFNIRQS